MHTISINIVNAQDSYKIYIANNNLSRVGSFIKEKFSSKKRLLIVADENAYKHHGALLLDALLGYNLEVFLVHDAEEAKNLQQVEKMTSWCLQKKYDRHSVVLCFGGGAVGDLGGFFASVYMRGVPFVQIPTTLLAQVDASVGGKTAVNTREGKNIIGTFCQPKLVVIDPGLLLSLPKKHLHSGLAECIKMAVIDDGELFSFLESFDYVTCAPLLKIILDSVEIKARIIEKDVNEKNIRMFLNLGHTTAHAVEAITNYSVYLHGQTVAFGCIVAAIIAEKIKVCSRKESERIQKVFAKVLKNCDFSSLCPQKIITAMQYDKKKQGDKIPLILPLKVGKVAVFDNVEEKYIIESIQAAQEIK